jgi:hypothetical protein
MYHVDDTRRLKIIYAPTAMRAVRDGEEGMGQAAIKAVLTEL